MSDRQSASVRIRGREFRIRSDESLEQLERIADTVDRTMARVEERTGTVDSYDVALLTALNLAREVVGFQESAGAPPGQLRELIELAESALRPESG